jgi:hypothetical protein
VFGAGMAVSLDRNAKARVMAYAVAYTLLHRRPRQHRGPLTRAYLDVLEALLWGFHNSRSGASFPSYERIAESAMVGLSTVGEALHALGEARVLRWENRLVWQRTMRPGLFGPEPGRVPRRTSNAYQLLDPKPQARPVLPKSGNRTGTRNQDSLCLSAPALDPASPSEAALIRLRESMAAKEAGQTGGEVVGTGPA